jgi:capsular polysaccharide biosynthesis protein
MESIVARFAGTIQRTGEIAAVEYSLPAHASEEVRAFFAARAVAGACGRFVAELPGGRVYGAGAILSPDGRIVARDVSPDFGRSEDDHWLRTYDYMRSPAFQAGRTGVIAVTLGNGYSHWLLEELPRLLAVRATPLDAVIANVGLPMARDAIARAGFRGEIIPAKRDRHWQCERLIVPSFPAQPNLPTRESVEAVREFTERSMAGSTGCGAKLYVSRAKARRRRVVNEAELESTLGALGFETVFLEEMPWTEQIRRFSAAREIVAAHGAGLANLVFCGKGTRVVELFNRDYVNPCFWRVAALRELDYRPLMERGEGPLDEIPAANRRDVFADIELVTRALRD